MQTSASAMLKFFGEEVTPSVEKNTDAVLKSIAEFIIDFNELKQVGVAAKHHLPICRQSTRG